MPTYYVHHAAAGAGTGADWANAYTTLTAALAVATSADLIYVAHDHSQSIASALTLTLPTSPGLRVLCVNRTSGALATTAVEAVGASSAALSVQGFGYIYGLDFLAGTNNSGNCSVFFGTGTVASGLVLENCKATLRTASSFANITFGPTASTGNDNISVTMLRPAFKFANAGQGLVPQHGRSELIGVSLDASGTAPTTLIKPLAATTNNMSITASDLSGVTWTNLIQFSASQGAHRIQVSQCKLPSGWSATTGTGEIGMAELFVNDCDSGDVHTFFGYYNGLGSIVSDTANYLTAGPAGQSWRITTTSAVTARQPFCTPWINQHNTATASVTPYIECLRNNGTATAYNDGEVWAEIAVKTDAGFANSTLYTDWIGPLGGGSAQAAGVGTGSWTIGASNSPASFKCDTGAAVTPDEVGAIRGRICVGLASIDGTLYVDPCVRW